MKSSELLGKTVYAFIMAVVILFTAVFSSISYAWLVNYKKSGDFDFSATELSPYTLEIAKIDTTTITNTDTEDAIEGKRTYTKLTDFIIETDNPTPGPTTTTPTKSTVTLSNMSFGRIDNVAQLKNENYVYLRLTVPKELGDTVKLNLHYNSASFIKLYKNLYDTDGLTVTGTEEVTDQTTLNSLVAVENAENANDTFLLYNAVVSNDSWEAAQIKDNVTFDDANQKQFTKFADYEANPATTTLELKNDSFSTVADDGNWYVYIRIIPNLAVFAYSIEYISDIMPCYMYFNVGATFESNPL